MSSRIPAATHRPRRRLLLDNDWAGDPDGLVALAHHLLSSDRVDAVTSSFVPAMFPGSEDGARRGLGLAADLSRLVAARHTPDFAAGAETAGRPSAASDLIVAHARRDDPLPLVVVCAGPLTNVAAALATDPGIVERLRLIWVGGRVGEGFEYNRDMDPDAATAVFAQDGLAIEQFPFEAYDRTTVSLAELEDALAETPVGRWLWRAFVDLPLPDEIDVGELWHLGDSLPVLATLAGEESAHRVVRTEIDHRLLWGDLRAKLRLHARAGQDDRSR